MTCFEFRIAPRCSALACARTFAWREVFFPTHMSPEKTDSDLFRRCGDETHEASILYPSIARWEGFFPSHRFLFCVVNWNWTLVLGDCFALRRKVLSREGKYPKFSGAVPRSPIFRNVVVVIRFSLWQRFRTDPLYSLRRAPPYVVQNRVRIRRNRKKT